MDSEKSNRIIQSAKPILVTGSHCSGTTWVGRMIAVSPDVTYIHEPFNVNHDRGICSARFDYWFTFISEQNEAQYQRDFEDTMALRYSLQGLSGITGGLKGISRAARNYTRFRKGRLQNNRPLLKDPIALFSADWLSATFDMDTIVMIRHPAAFAGSVKVKNRSHPFSHFLNQPLLMDEHLGAFRDEITYFSKEERPLIEQSALLWKLIHFMILKYKKTHPHWLYIRHEDLSIEPTKGFAGLYRQIGLDYSAQVSEVIETYSSGQASKKSSSEYRYKKINRESGSNIQKWKERLTDDEIRLLKSQVHDISKEFYSEDEW